jgi:hypothetical protein
MHLAAVEADPPEVEHPHLLGNQEDLDNVALEVRQESPAEMRQGVVIRTEVGRDEPEGRRFERDPFDLARAEHAGGLAVEHKPQQNLGCVRLAPARAVPGIDGRQVELGDRIHDEARQMIRRQTVAEPHRHVEGRLIVNGLERSVLTNNLAQPARRRLTFSPTDC